jgi:transglutaminase-like putative cysteine protease
LLLRIIVWVGLLLYSLVGYAEEQVQFQAAPTWIQTVKPGDLSGQLPVGGLRYLLVDKQVNLEQPTVARYFHFVLQISSTEGLEQASQLAFDYDPGYETLQIHGVSVLRNGQVLNRLEPKEIRVFQREPDLEHYLYSGTKTAYLILPDIRVGDTLEYNYTILGTNPVLGNKYSAQIQLDGDLPIAQSFMRVIVNPARQIHYSVPESKTGRLTLNDTSSHKELIWQESSIQPKHTEEDVPSWFSPYRFWSISEFNSWQDIVSWAQPLYDHASVITPEVAELANQLALANPAPKDKVMAALNFVQQEIRYLGIEDGIGSHLPRSAADTLYRRYGDCKDKTVLLMALLKAMGFAPKAALVSLDRGAILPNQLAAPIVFDHVIVTLALDGRQYWLDGTNLHQGTSLDSISTPDLHYALVIDPATTDFTPLTDPYRTSEIALYRELWLREPYSQLYVESRYTGESAETQRADMKSLSQQALSNQLLGYYAKIYFNLENKSKPAIQDDLTTNQLVIKQSFALSDSMSDMVKNGLPLYADLIDQQLKSIDSNRTQPLDIGEPVRIRQEFVFHLPYDVEIADYRQQYTHSLFTFNVTVHQYSPKLLRVVYRYQSTTGSVPVSELARYREFVQQVREDLALSFTIPPAPQAQVKQPEPETHS